MFIILTYSRQLLLYFIKARLFNQPLQLLQLPPQPLTLQFSHPSPNHTNPLNFLPLPPVPVLQLGPQGANLSLEPVYLFAPVQIIILNIILILLFKFIQLISQSIDLTISFLSVLLQFDNFLFCFF